MGPILLREGIKYLKEVNSMEWVTVYCELNWMFKDSSRWSLFHRMFKSDNSPVAELIVDGIWLELYTWELGTPSDKVIGIMKQFPMTDNFEWKP